VPPTKTLPPAASMSSTDAFEEMRCRSDHLLFEQPRRQRGRSAGQDSAAACIGPGAVRDDGAIALQDLDVLDPRAEFVGNHLRERGLEPLAV